MNYIILVKMIEAFQELSEQAFDYFKLARLFRAFKALCRP